jgi:hypothetical protein
MKRIKCPGKRLQLIITATGCMALVFLWPEWRSELRAQSYSCMPETLTQCDTITTCVSFGGRAGILARVKNCCTYDTAGLQCNPDTPPTCNVTGPPIFLGASCVFE